MIIYITGASGSGKTTLLRDLPIKGIDLDDIYEANWKKHRKLETVQKGVKHDINAILKKHATIAFVGLQSKEQLPFTPDKVFILIRNDFEQYYRDKLVRDLNLLCKYKKDFEEVLKKEPLDSFRDNFWSNEMVNMRSFDEFKKHVNHMNGVFQKNFKDGSVATASEIQKQIQMLLSDAV